MPIRDRHPALSLPCAHESRAVAAAGGRTAASLEAQEEEGLVALIERLRPSLRTILAFYRIPPADADDLLQSTITHALHRRSGIESLAGWMHGTLRNLCRLYHRRRRAEQRHQSLDVGDAAARALESELPPVPSPQDLLDLRADLDRLLAALPPTHRQVVILRLLVGLPPGQISARTSLAPASIGKIFARAMARLHAAAVQAGIRPR